MRAPLSNRRGRLLIFLCSACVFLFGTGLVLHQVRCIAAQNLLCGPLIADQSERLRTSISRYGSQGLAQPTSLASTELQTLHILIPATDTRTNLCKTILTTSILGYPKPTLIAFNKTFDQGPLLGGGSHLAKITDVLKHLESMPASMDNDLVLMMDAYDIWFQLPPDLLVHRYHAINGAAYKRLTARMGSAASAEGIHQSIIFGAGKRSAPNQLHTIACYPIPDSPLPMDLYGGNTNTVMGWNKYSSLRQRFLNSGYAIGPIADMRRLFRRAQKKLESTPELDTLDNGSHGSDSLYHGSDQSIFNTIFGEQEFQREVSRRRHRSLWGWVIGRGKPPAATIGLDYWSELGRQTVNSEPDGRFIRFADATNLDNQIGHQSLFECKSRVTGQLPDDMTDVHQDFSMEAWAGLNETFGLLPRTWSQRSLYTNICLNRVPVMTYYNGDKEARVTAWTRLWMQPFARLLMGEVLRKDEVIATIGLPGSQKGVEWNEICHRDMEAELFRVVDPSLMRTELPSKWWRHVQ